MSRKLNFVVGVVLSLMMFSSLANSFQIDARNLIGKAISEYNSVPLPARIKANSGYVPICRIDISTNAGNSGYVLEAATITIRNWSNFDLQTDLLALGSDGVTIFRDNQQGYHTVGVSTTSWDGSGTEVKLTPDSIMMSSTTGPSTWSIRFGFTGGNRPDAGLNASKYYTFYVCVKTGSILDDDQFRLQDPVEVNIGGNTSSINLDTVAQTMIADTVSPAIQLAYTISSTNGTSRTVFNTDTYNIYSTTDIAITADSSISLKVTLEENAAALTNGVYTLNDLFTFDTAALDNNLSNMKSVTSAGNEYTIGYTLLNTASTIDKSTTPVTIKIKARDAAGNETAQDESFYCYIDRTRPSAVTINSPADGAWIGINSPQLSWQENNDPNLFGYRIICSSDGNLTDFVTNTTGNGFKMVSSIYTNWSNSGWNNFTPTASTTTVYYWGVVALDKAQNIGSYSDARQFKFDDNTPNMYNETPTTAQSTKRPTISVQTDDALGGTPMSGINISTITFKINNQSVSFTTSVVNASTMTISYTPSIDYADGAYTASVWVMDNAGKQITKVWGFSIDATTPESKDTDNDGYSDRNENSRGTNPNDPTSKPGVTADFYPLNGEYVNASAFVSTKAEKINIRLDDTGSYSSGLDVAYTTASVNKIVINHLTRSTTETWYYVPGDSWVGSSSATLVVQMARALSAVGSDDGEIRITYPVRDSVGLQSSAVRNFYYDNTPPVISTVSVPSSADTEGMVSFTVNAVDNLLISDGVDAVQLCIGEPPGMIWTYNMIKSTSNQYTFDTGIPGEAGTQIYYYFQSKDKAGNMKVYPPTADTDKNYAFLLTINDKTAPKASLYEIKTLLSYNVQGVTVTFTSGGSGNTGVKNIPQLYADPAGDTSNDYNLIKATVPAEATSVTFEYKLSSATTWTSVAVNKTQDIVGGNSVWQAYWNTTGLPVDANYDIRVIASDSKGNTSTPATNDHPGWAQVYLVKALAPTVKIDTSQNFPKNGGVVSGPKLLLNANVSNTKNMDVSSIKFQYKKLNEPETTWTEIAADNDPTSATKTPVTIYLMENELPYINVLNGVEISSITSAVLDEITSGTLYDKNMSRSGSNWQVTIPFSPGTYRYNYQVTTPMTSKTLTKDTREYANNGGNSQIMINSFAFEWDISGLTNGESYQIRGVAKDSKNNEDISPETIAITYNGSVPAAPAITQPSSFKRLKAGATTIKASLPSSEVYVNRVIFEYSVDGINWHAIGSDTNVADGWSIAYTVPGLITDTIYYLRSFAVNNPPAISNVSSVVSFIIDPTIPVIQSFWVEGATGTVILNSGASYVLKATTLNNDIAMVTFTCGGGVAGTLTPNNGVVYTPTSGTGTSSDPYTYTCNLTLTNADLILSGSLSVVMQDYAGNNSTAKSMNVQVRDVTPTVATLSRYNNGTVWIPFTDSSLSYIGKAGPTLEATLSDNDGGTLRFQYSTNQSGPWTTIAEVAIDATTKTCAWNPYATGVPEGTYYVLALAIDNNDNVDPSPVTVQVKLDYVDPTINSISVSPTGTINPANTYIISANSNDTDIKTIVFQYYDPILLAWTTIDAGIAGRLITVVSNNITPNTVGLTQAVYTCVSPRITKATTLQVRAIATDRANNSNGETDHAPVINLSFNDTEAPSAVPNIDTNGNVFAETGDANVRSVVFQYKVSGSNQPFIDLSGLDVINNPGSIATYGNVGMRWQCGTTLGNLPAGTYDLRTIATDMFNNVDINKAPVVTALIEINAAGSKVYSLRKSQQISVGVSDVQFDNVGGAVLTLQVQSATALVSAPVVSLLVTDGGANTITKTVTLSGSGTTFSGTVTLENFAQAGAGSARISVSGNSGSGVVYGESAGLAISAAATNPACTTIDNMARVTGWNTVLPQSVSLLIAPRITPNVPASQTNLITPIGRCYEFRLSDNTEIFSAGSSANLRLDYSDSDITAAGVDESKLGIAWWDETNQKWSADGITVVNVNRTTNQATFTVSHFTAFALVAINSVPALTIESPRENRYSDENPLISVKVDDSFSGIAPPRVEIDGIDVTATIVAYSASDGVDNNGNGMIDEKGGNDANVNEDESAFNTLSNVSARIVGRPPLKLTKGEHTLTVTAWNVQDQMTVQTFKFNVSDRLSFAANPYNYPNPFDPRKATTKIVTNLSRESRVKVQIYDFAGNKVATLEKDIFGQAGPVNEIEWNGYEESTKKYLADGVYFAAIEATRGSETVKKFLKIGITSSK